LRNFTRTDLDVDITEDGKVFFNTQWSYYTSIGIVFNAK